MNIYMEVYIYKKSRKVKPLNMRRRNHHMELKGRGNVQRRILSLACEVGNSRIRIGL